MKIEEKLEYLKKFIEELDKSHIYEYDENDKFKNKLTIDIANKFKDRAWHILADITD